MAATQDSAEAMEADSGAVTAAATDFTVEAVDTMVADVASMVEVVDTMVATMGTAVVTMDTTVATMDTVVDTMGTTQDITDTIGIMDTDTMAAAGAFRGYSVLDGIIRGTGIQIMGIPIMAIMIPTTLTPATMEIPATTGIRTITIRITTGMMARRRTATRDILITDIGVALVMAEDITHIPAGGITTRVGYITADSPAQVNGGAPQQGAPLLSSPRR